MSHVSSYRKSFNHDNLSIFIDSDSLDPELSQSNRHVKTLLLFESHSLFKFMRTPYNTQNTALETIPTFKKETDNGNIKTLVIIGSGDTIETARKILFGHNEEEIEQLGRHIFSRDSLTEYHKESIRSVLMCAKIFRERGQNRRPLFVTRNEVLLKKRLKFQESYLPIPYILTVEEAMERMDLFAKSHGKYFTSRPNQTLDRGFWYWSSFRSKVPHYNVPGSSAFEPRPILEAFASRFTYLLLCIDEIGIEYYFSKDADIMIPYHFNYFLPLVTGIFDSLALAARDKYSLKFVGDQYPNETSLYGRGEEFRKELKNHNPRLGDHRDRNFEFLDLIYKLRELAIHREGFRTIGIELEEKVRNFLVINEEIVQLIRNCGDKILHNEQISNWGVFTDPVFVLLEPYHFTRLACLKLVEFADKFVELLGFDRFDDPEISFFREHTLDAGRWRIYDK